MNTRIHGLRAALFALALVSVAPLASAGDFTVRIVDQFGAPLPDALISIPASAEAVPSGSTVSLPEGLYSASISLRGGLLNRRLAEVAVDATTTAIDFEWQTREVTLQVQDQSGVQISGARIVTLVGTVDNGSSIALPINATTFYPDLNPAAAFTNNHVFLLSLFQGQLVRTKGGVIVHGGSSFEAFPWGTQAVTVAVVDHEGAVIPDSFVGTPVGLVASGSTVALPINDSLIYPDLQQMGFFEDYRLVPSLYSNRLYRFDEGIVINPGVHVLPLEWITVSGYLTVVDANAMSLPGSTITLDTDMITRLSGDLVTLPITDNAQYPRVSGDFGDGYPITIAPITTSVAATYSFEVMRNAELRPDFVQIDGQSIGLRLVDNHAPGIIADDNLNIFTSEQVNTVLSGVASDVDDQTLSYRWLADGVEVQGFLPVGPEGETPLDLGAIAPLATGAHDFVVEVTDGIETVSDSLVLVLDNSPPDAVTVGDAVVQLDDDVLLRGSVSDYDADLLQYTWSEDGVAIYSSFVNALAGGAPVDLDPVLVSGPLDLGTHVYTLSVSDGENVAIEASLQVEVIDLEKPVLAPAADTPIVWPPDHSMRTVVIEANASDASGLPVSLEAYVTSSANPERDAAGNTIPDFTEPVIDPFAGTVTLDVRAEREGRGSGRVYSVLIIATDTSGNASEATIDILCPHDQGE